MTNFFKPVWSRQHGAYITLITSWLAGTLLSEQLYPIHFVILVMLLAGFNFTEFTQDQFLRNSPPSPQKRFWTRTYFALAVTSGICVIINVTEFKFILPFIVFAALIFLLLTKLKLHKSILSEFLMFAVLSLAGLISYNPHYNTSFLDLFPLWLLMFLYFSSTIFLVKIRFERVSVISVIIYLTISTLLLFFVRGNELIVWLTAVLMLLRLLPVITAQQWFKSLRITIIGFIELGFQILFLACILFSLK
jgi:hypothetical protein